MIKVNKNLGTEKIAINIHKNSEIFPKYINAVDIDLLDGIIHQIKAKTKGVIYQNEIANDLIKEFGNPNYNSFKFSQNIENNVDIRISSWVFYNNTTVVFYGLIGASNSGQITLSTNKFNNLTYIEQK